MATKNNGHRKLTPDEIEAALRIVEKAGRYGLELGQEARELMERIGRKAKP